MTDENHEAIEADGGLFKEEHREGPLLDPMENVHVRGLGSEFDDLLKDLDSGARASLDGEFGALSEAEIQQGVSGLTEPELSGEPLGPGEIAFGVSAAELQTILGALTALLKFQPAAQRRCRLLISSSGVIWHANAGNAFIEYITRGRPSNFDGSSSYPVIVSLGDLYAAARTVRHIATFRIKEGAIRFSTDRFLRPILRHSMKGYPTHTDTLCRGVDTGAARPQVSSATIHKALSFLARIAPSEGANPSFNFIEIKQSVARALRLSMGAQVQSSVFDGLDMTFKPRFLRWVIPALKLRATFQIWHSDKFCLFRNDELTFGFELAQQELPKLPGTLKVSDTLLVPTTAFATFVQRAARMFREAGRVVIQSDEQGAAALVLMADDAGETSRKLEMSLDGYRREEHVGPLRLVMNVEPLLRTLSMGISSANIEIAVGNKAVYVEEPLDDARLSVVLSAEVQR
jgi:hypothetical protein